MPNGLDELLDSVRRLPRDDPVRVTDRRTLDNVPTTTGCLFTHETHQCTWNGQKAAGKGPTAPAGDIGFGSRSLGHPLILNISACSFVGASIRVLSSFQAHAPYNETRRRSADDSASAPLAPRMLHKQHNVGSCQKWIFKTSQLFCDVETALWVLSLMVRSSVVASIAVAAISTCMPFVSAFSMVPSSAVSIRGAGFRNTCSINSVANRRISSAPLALRASESPPPPPATGTKTLSKAERAELNLQMWDAAKNGETEELTKCGPLSWPGTRGTAPGGLMRCSLRCTLAELARNGQAGPGRGAGQLLPA